jgi:hypothetical protein
MYPSKLSPGIGRGISATNGRMFVDLASVNEGHTLSFFDISRMASTVVRFVFDLKGS